MAEIIAATERVRLERPEDEHVTALTVLGDEEVVRHLGGEVWTEDSVRGSIALWHDIESALGVTTWVVRENDSGDVIGTCGFAGTNAPWLQFSRVIEIGWTLGRRWWGQGLATEAAHAALRASSDRIPRNRIISKCGEENKASERVMIRLGMQRVGTVRGRPTSCTIVYRFPERTW